jgi:DNA-binding HxlR family transcriptional regulator
MAKRRAGRRRSDCPLNVALEIFGDSWSLLVVRDLLFDKRHEFKDYLASEERIATNVLSDRLRRLEESGIIARRPHPTDARKVDYRLTEKGLDLAPVLFEMALWATRHERTEAPPLLLRRMSEDREKLIAELRTEHLAAVARDLPQGARSSDKACRSS